MSGSSEQLRHLCGDATGRMANDQLGIDEEPESRASMLERYRKDL